MSKLTEAVHKAQIEENRIHFRRYYNEIRMWRDSWSGDMFEITTLDEFHILFDMARRLSFHFIIHFNDDTFAGCIDWQTVLDN